MKLLDRVFNPREIRRRLGLNQEQFWTQIGVTQSGGSRYESGREMPRPVKELLRLVHVEQIDLSQVKRVDFEIISYLKDSHPDLYRNLRRAVKGRFELHKKIAHWTWPIWMYVSVTGVVIYLLLYQIFPQH